METSQVVVLGMATVLAILFILWIVAVANGFAEDIQTKSSPPLVDLSIFDNPSPQHSDKYRPWNSSQLLVAAYLATFYKVSNERLIDKVASLLERDSSSLIRKINRMRGFNTGKDNGLSSDDIRYMSYCSRRTQATLKGLFLDQLIMEGGYDKGLEYLLEQADSENSSRN